MKHNKMNIIKKNTDNLIVNASGRIVLCKGIFSSGKKNKTRFLAHDYFHAV